MDRETLGQIVRAAWIKWAKTQPNPKESWFTSWDELSEEDKEADRQIGETIRDYVVAELFPGAVLTR